MWDKLEKTFHLMHLLTVVSQLAANKTNRRTGLLCQNKEYKQLLTSIGNWLVLQNFWMDILDNLFWECQNFLDNVQKEKLIVKSCFWSGPKKGWHSKNWIGFQKHELGIWKKFRSLNSLLSGSEPLPNNKKGPICYSSFIASNVFWLLLSSHSFHESFFEP